jgi:hypothetical protein
MLNAPDVPIARRAADREGGEHATGDHAKPPRVVPADWAKIGGDGEAAAAQMR